MNTIQDVFCPASCYCFEHTNPSQSPAQFPRPQSKFLSHSSSTSATPTLDGHVTPTQFSTLPPHPGTAAGAAKHYTPNPQLFTQQYRRSLLDVVSSYNDSSGGGRRLPRLGDRRPVHKRQHPLRQLGAPRPDSPHRRTARRANRR